MHAQNECHNNEENVMWRARVQMLLLHSWCKAPRHILPPQRCTGANGGERGGTVSGGATRVTVQHSAGSEPMRVILQNVKTRKACNTAWQISGDVKLKE